MATTIQKFPNALQNILNETKPLKLSKIRLETTQKSTKTIENVPNSTPKSQKTSQKHPKTPKRLLKIIIHGVFCELF